MQATLEKLKNTHPKLQELRIVRFADGVARDAAADINPKSAVALICDDNTYKALGQSLAEALSIPPLILPSPVHADDKAVEWLRAKTQAANLLLAVGSGTINDLCKYVSYLDNKPYISYPTAPSMNGYVSANAAITVAGHKKSLAAHMPSAVICDMAVLAKAPKRLIQSGLGDSLCRSTAQSDWLLSHLLLGTPYDSLPFDLLKENEAYLLNNAAFLAEENPAATAKLMETLLLSGLGMVLAGGSYPASQGEHLVAHTMEMTHPEMAAKNYHGEQIAVTTLIMARLQEKLLTVPLQFDKPRTSALQTHFEHEVIQSIIKEYEPKSNIKGPRLTRLWSDKKDEIAQSIAALKVSAVSIEKALSAVGAPTTFTDLGWGQEEAKAAMHHAHFIRNRFTFLDIAYQAGIGLA